MALQKPQGQNAVLWLMAKNNCAAVFKTSKAFSIVGIGQVLTGQILEGEVQAGNHISFSIAGKAFSYRIDAVEYVDYPLRNLKEVGLIFDLASEDIQPRLQAILGQTISIIV